MLLLCITSCKIPKRGYVEKGSKVDLEIAKYDLKAYPWLKFFQAPDAPKPAPRKDDNLLK